MRFNIIRRKGAKDANKTMCFLLNPLRSLRHCGEYYDKTSEAQRSKATRNYILGI
jgi:hypothetical protein